MAGTSSPDPCSALSTEHAPNWASRQSPAERARLADAYTPLVHRLARRLFARRVGSELEFVDLVQMGMVGLLEAMDRYTPARGVRFETFATYRIEGAMRNGMPSYSEFQRQLALRRELVRERVGSLIERGSDEHRASALERLGELAVGVALGFSLEIGSERNEEVSEPDNAYARLELAQLRHQLGDLVGLLPETERRVIFRHYFQQQTFEEVAHGLGLSKGRISQLHHAALRRLREKLQSLRPG